MPQLKLQTLEGVFLPPEDRMPVWGDGRTLRVNEVFYSIEGEGLRVGEPTTFVRLARCNLCCSFCDTEHESHVETCIEGIRDEVRLHSAKWVCLTGGEPLAQNVAPFCRLLRADGYRVCIETNGSIDPPPELLDLIEHWTVSPKVVHVAQGLIRIAELKYVVGEAFREDMVEEGRAGAVYLQPESGRPEYVQKALEILMRHPDWRLSCRIHKMLHLP